MLSIVSGSTLRAKQSTMLYSCELGCETLLVHGLQPTVRHGSKNLYGNYDDDITVSTASYLTCFLTRLVKRNASPVAKLGIGAASMGRGSSERRDGVTSTFPVQKETAAHCTILPPMSPWTPGERQPQQCAY